MVTAGILPFRENSHGLAGNRSRDLMISSQRLTARPRGWSQCVLYVGWSWWLLQYLLTPWSRVLLEKLTVSKLVNKFPTFYGTRRFIIAFTSARHLSLSWAGSIQSIPLHPTSWISILILSSHLRLGLPSGLFTSGFSTKTPYAFLLSPLRATCPAHLILLDFIARTILGEQYRSLSSSLYSFLHFTVSSSLLDPNILLNTLFSDTLSLRSSRQSFSKYTEIIIKVTIEHIKSDIQI